MQKLDKFRDLDLEKDGDEQSKQGFNHVPQAAVEFPAVSAEQMNLRLELIRLEQN